MAKFKCGFLNVLVGVGLVGIGLIGCAKDKTIDDYNRQKLLEDVAAYQVIKGDYTGYLISSINNQPAGALHIGLQVRPPTSGGSDKSGSGVPVILTQMDFLNDNQMSVSSPTSYYDPERGLLQVEFEISRAADSAIKERISLTSQVRGGRLTGSVQALGYSSYGGTFDLVRGGKDLKDLIRSLPSKPTTGTAIQVTSFSGTTTFKNKVVKPVKIVVLQPRINAQEDFLNLLIPVKSVQVSLNYDISAQINNPTSNWDQRTGSLNGQTTITRENQGGDLVARLPGGHGSEKSDG